jgi:small subunit ribosomal protein S1
MTESFAELFEQSIASQRIRPGTILNGLIVEVGQDYVIVNVGLKSEAVIPADQFKNEKGEIEVVVGETVEVALDSVEDGSGETRLSREKAKRARTWTRLETAFEKQEVVIGMWMCARCAILRISKTNRSSSRSSNSIRSATTWLCRAVRS